MGSPDTAKAAPALAGSDPRKPDRLGGAIDSRNSRWREQYKVPPAADVFPIMEGDELAKLGQPRKSIRARARLRAWCRILDTLAEQREALQLRIWREYPGEIHLAAECQAWCELARSLTNLLRARRGE